MYSKVRAGMFGRNLVSEIIGKLLNGDCSWRRLEEFVSYRRSLSKGIQVYKLPIMPKETSKDDAANKEPVNTSSSSEEEDQESAGASGLTSLEECFTNLGIRSINVEDRPKVLDDVSLDGIIEYIKKNNCKNIITLAGAGISTAAGIPDFRSPGSGLYDNLQKYNLPHPTAVFELGFFHENPRPFFELAKELYPGKFEPTYAHYFVRLLHEKGLLLRHYTQNIDTLERIAGIPEELLVEAHGTFHCGHCLHCRKEYTQEWMKDKIFSDTIPTCTQCPGVVKPDIVFFGEMLPTKFHKSINQDFDKCDLLIIMGSSLIVQPFCSLVDKVRPTVPRLLINKEKAGHRSGVLAFLSFNEGLDFDNPENTRDVAWLGSCDDGVLQFAEKMGWKEELVKLRKDELEKLKK